jgi:hypothetical protein
MSLKCTFATLLLTCISLWAGPKEPQKDPQSPLLPASRNTFMVFGNTYITKLETKTSILASINQAVKDADIDFVIMVGELTMGATVDQFKAVQYVMENSSVPVHVTASNHDLVYHVIEASLGAEIDRKNKPMIGINGGTKEAKYHVIANRHVKVVPIENKATDQEDDYLIFIENEGFVVVDSYVDRRLDKSFKILIDRSAGEMPLGAPVLLRKNPKQNRIGVNPTKKSVSIGMDAPGVVKTLKVSEDRAADLLLSESAPHKKLP